jgi:uncharacterized protein YdeI (YjbR/CyaY-like superfamily)
MKPRHFKSGDEFRAWLAKHGAREREVWVGFYRKSTGKGGLTYKEALDEALCAGWIDGLRKRVDDASYAQRFSPRTPTSIWSAINLERIKELIAAGRMTKAGLEVYERRDPKRAGLYSFENRPKQFDAGLERMFRSQAEAWTFFRAQPPGYQRVCTWFVMSAKKDETRQRRLEMLIKASSEGKRMTWM